MRSLFIGLISISFVLSSAEQEPFQREKERLMNYVEYVHSKGLHGRDNIYTLLPSLLKAMFFLKRPKISCPYINSLSDHAFAALKFDVLCFPSFDVPDAKHQDDIVEAELELLVQRMDKCRSCKK